MNGDEIARLAAVANALRPDWKIASLRTFLERHLAGRAYGDTAIAIAYVTTKTDTETPRLLLEAGPWWRIADGQAGPPRPPRADEACHRCGRHRDRCICETAPHVRPPALDAATDHAHHVQAARDAIRAATAQPHDPTSDDRDETQETPR